MSTVSHTHHDATRHILAFLDAKDSSSLAATNKRFRQLTDRYASNRRKSAIALGWKRERLACSLRFLVNWLVGPVALLCLLLACVLALGRLESIIDRPNVETALLTIACLSGLPGSILLQVGFTIYWHRVPANERKSSIWHGQFERLQSVLFSGLLQLSIIAVVFSAFCAILISIAGRFGYEVGFLYGLHASLRAVWLVTFWLPMMIDDQLNFVNSLFVMPPHVQSASIFLSTRLLMDVPFVLQQHLWAVLSSSAVDTDYLSMMRDPFDKPVAVCIAFGLEFIGVLFLFLPARPTKRIAVKDRLLKVSYVLAVVGTVLATWFLSQHLILNPPVPQSQLLPWQANLLASKHDATTNFTTSLSLNFAVRRSYGGARIKAFNKATPVPLQLYRQTQFGPKNHTKLVWNFNDTRGTRATCARWCVVRSTPLSNAAPLHSCSVVHCQTLAATVTTSMEIVLTATHGINALMCATARGRRVRLLTKMVAAAGQRQALFCSLLTKDWSTKFAIYKRRATM